jgi:uncharacterized protein YgiM (DUF1202 family)
MREFVKFIILNACYVWNKQNNISIKPTHIIIHSTATPGVMAKQWFDRWNKASIQVAVHAFIDNLELWQLLPFNFWAWGVGGKANGYSLQIEMCEDRDHSEAYFREVLANTIKTVAGWCVTFKIPVDHIIGHYEARILGIGSNHSDPRLWWDKFGYTMDMFRDDVEKALSKPVIVALEKPIDEKVCSDDLNIRYGPGINFKVLATMPQGTKVEVYSVSGSWAKVKYKEVQGFCSMTYLKEFLTGYVTASVLNVRAGRGVSNSIIGKLKKGAPVTLYGLQGGWWETPTGYVSADWISLDKVATPVEIKLLEGIVTATAGLNVRKSPGGAKVGALKHGTKVKIYEQLGTWYRIGKEQWVSATYIRK